MKLCRVVCYKSVTFFCNMPSDSDKKWKHFEAKNQTQVILNKITISVSQTFGEW